MKQEKEVKSTQVGKEEAKLLLFVNEKILYIEILTIPPKILEQIRKKIGGWAKSVATKSYKFPVTK